VVDNKTKPKTELEYDEEGNIKPGVYILKGPSENTKKLMATTSRIYNTLVWNYYINKKRTQHEEYMSLGIFKEPSVEEYLMDMVNNFLTKEEHKKIINKLNYILGK
jgi:hypothetical protein